MEQSNNRGLRVLWAFDGSAGSEAAAPVLQRLAASNIARVRVLSVAPHKLLSGARPEPSFLSGATEKARLEAVAAAQEVAVRGALALPDVPVCKEPVSVWGNPVQVILGQSSEFKPDLTVLGSKGQSGLRFLALGSVSSAVVQHASHPVLVVRPGHEKLSRVLLAYDGSPPARKLLEFVTRLLDRKDTQILLVRVVEPFTVPPGTPLGYRLSAIKEAHEITQRQSARAARSLDAAKASLEAEGFTVAIEVLIGDPALKLLDAANQHEADLVAVGSRKPSRARHYLLGSTAERLVRHCTASVLVVR